MPAELSLYLLNFVDRIIIVRTLGLPAAGLYSLAVKFAQGVNVLVRGFQLAWPPLAYSIRDDGEARRVYAIVVTWFVAAMSLRRRRHVAALALDRPRPGSPEVLRRLRSRSACSPPPSPSTPSTWSSSSSSAERAARSSTFPPPVAALAVNVGLNLALVPPLGIVGAGLALVASYLVVLVLMYVFTQRLFPVPYEWGRLARVVLVAAVLVGAGELLLPTAGFGGLAGRDRVLARLPPGPPRHRLLHHAASAAGSSASAIPVGLAAELRALRPAAGRRRRRRSPRPYEAELMDEDSAPA